MTLTQISTAGVKDDAVTSGKIPANAVGSSEIAANAVGSSELADNAVDTAAIADDAVTTAKIANEAVTLAKLPHGTSSNDGKFLRANNGADPTFETVTGTTINNNADNRVITGSGTANTLNGESSVTIDGSGILAIQGSGQRDILIGSTNAGGAAIAFDGDSNGDGAGSDYALIRHNTDGNLEITTRNPSGATATIFKQGTTESLRIDSSGRVIIGSTSTIGNTYSNNFTISEANGNAGMQIEGVNGNTGYASIYFGDAGHRQRHYIESQLGTNGQLNIGTIGTGATRINNSGGTVARFDLDGIKFGSDTAAANALDDYEEGTWTPAISGLTFSDAQGQYIKIGTTCFVNLSLNGSNTSKTGDVRITGLPYTPKSGSGEYYPANSIPFFEVGSISLASSFNNIYGRIDYSAGNIQLLVSDGESHNTLTGGGGTTLNSNLTLRTSFTYQTAS